MENGILGPGYVTVPVKYNNKGGAVGDKIYNGCNVVASFPE